MSQRNSGFTRVPDEHYATIAWPIVALLSQLDTVELAWDPCDRGSGELVATLRSQGVAAIGTRADFLATTAPPAGVTHLITNPPYGPKRKGEAAEHFIEHALALRIPCIAMLLRNDFDSAIGRPRLFRDNPQFAGKVILLGRIKWFEGPSQPSDNHSWFLWDRTHRGAPLIRYAACADAMRTLVSGRVA
jgi:hypothetical protein